MSVRREMSVLREIPLREFNLRLSHPKSTAAATNVSRPDSQGVKSSREYQAVYGHITGAITA